MRKQYTTDGKTRSAYNCWFAPDGQWRAETCQFDDKVIENADRWHSHHIVRGKSAVVYILSMTDNINRIKAIEIATAIVQGKVRKCLINLNQ